MLGAFALIGSLVMAAGFLLAARRDGSLAMARFGYRSLLFAALPAFVVTRIAAQWIASEEGVADSDAAWIGIGYVSTDVGVLILIGATVAAGLAVRRAGNAEAAGPPGRGAAVAASLVSALVVLYAIVIWVMAAKPV